MRKGRSISLRRGCEIEVCAKEDDLEGAEFKAILEDRPIKSGTKKLRVRYVALEADDGYLLLERVCRRFIRPVPPENLFFVKKIDDNKHLVYFDSPPDLIHFKRRQLRQHFDWNKAGELNELGVFISEEV